jgi:calcium-dependent protein kinase
MGAHGSKNHDSDDPAIGDGIYTPSTSPSLLGAIITPEKLSLREKLTAPRTVKDFPLVYHTKQELGEGITGRVSKVVDNHGRDRAVKMSYGFPRSNKPQLRELHAELTFLRAVDHPNIVKLVEHYEDPPLSVKIVIDICKGGNLASDSGKARLDNSEPRTAYVVYQIFLAIKFIHDRGIAHRDIKEENVMFVSADPNSLHVQLIDFGLSGLVQQGNNLSMPIHRLKTFCGTLPYMSPEVLAKDYDLQSDLWSMGVLIYELLTGALPFEGDTDRSIIKKIQKGKIDYSIMGSRHLSSSALELVQHLLVVPSSRRWTAAFALRSEWFKGCKSTTEEAEESVEARLVASILKFAGYNRIRQMMMIVSAHFSPPPVIIVEQLHKCFVALDLDYSGSLSVDELSAMLDRNGCGNSKHVFAQIDFDSANEVSWTNFLAMAFEAFVQIDETGWTRAFDYLALGRHRVKILRLLDLLGCKTPGTNENDGDIVVGQENNKDEDEPRKGARECIENADLDHDGYLTQDEFQNLLRADIPLAMM